MYSIHATKKLLDRAKPAIAQAHNDSTTLLGNWYATALFWRPQLVQLVNELTLLPVLMPPASSSSVVFTYQLPACSFND